MYARCTFIPWSPTSDIRFCGRLEPNQLGPKINVAIETKRNQPQISIILLHETLGYHKLPRARYTQYPLSARSAPTLEAPVFRTRKLISTPQDLTSEWNLLPPIKTVIQDYLTLSASVVSQSPGTGGHTKHWADH